MTLDERIARMRAKGWRDEVGYQRLTGQAVDLALDLADEVERLRAEVESTSGKVDIDSEDVAIQLDRGGPWLGAARNWIKWHLRDGGDSRVWGSRDEVKIPFGDLEDIAKAAAVAAVEHDRKGRKTASLKLVEHWRIEQEVKALRVENSRLKEAAMRTEQLANCDAIGCPGCGACDR